MKRLSIVAILTMAHAGSLAAPSTHDRADAQSPRTTRPSAFAVAPVLDPSVYAVRLKPPSLEPGETDNFVFQRVGLIHPRGVEETTFVLPKLPNLKGLLLGDRLAWSFRSPRGETILPEPGTPESLGMAFLYLDDPEEGLWTVRVASAAQDTAAQYAVQLFFDGPAEEMAGLETIVVGKDHPRGFVARPGDPVFIRATVVKRRRAVTGTHWDVWARTPSDSYLVVPLFDDGRHADGQADDGVFVGAVIAQGPDGAYHFVGNGRTPQGVEYGVVRWVEVKSYHDLLIADSITVSPRNPRAGEAVKLIVTVRNEGTVDSRDLGLNLEVAENTPLPTEDEKSAQAFDLRAGESKRIVTTWTPKKPGSYEVRLEIDPYKETGDEDYTNNWRKTVVRVR